MREGRGTYVEEVDLFEELLLVVLELADHVSSSCKVKSRLVSGLFFENVLKNPRDSNGINNNIKC